MGKRQVLLPVEDVDWSAVKYEREEIKAPHLTGLQLKLFIRFIESPLGPLIMSFLKKQNKINELLRGTRIPEHPMFRPEFPSQEAEPSVLVMEEENIPTERVESALRCLPSYEPSSHLSGGSSPFLYWKIRDFAYAYRSGLVTPLTVAEHVILGVEEFNNKNPPMPWLVSFSAEEVRKQAEASTKRFEEENPLSILDGVFVAIKDDIDCHPYPTKGGSNMVS
ncbi:hypothetical protein Sjap_018854 [Stephania japonica]|uniref:Uncharacterized protein n=1 Tax=Stephania japonica TaxID=461633 RepID=A0AAP0I8P8_9MAGN